MRPVTISLWTVTCFLLAPSKIAAVAYALFLGLITLGLFIALGVIGALGSVMQRYWRS